MRSGIFFYDRGMVRGIEDCVVSRKHVSEHSAVFYKRIQNYLILQNKFIFHYIVKLLIFQSIFNSNSNNLIMQLLPEF